MDGSPLEQKPDTRNPAAVALSKLGASKGGLAGAASLSDRKRKAIAKRAAQARFPILTIRCWPSYSQPQYGPLPWGSLGTVRAFWPEFQIHVYYVSPEVKFYSI